ncbi:MAG: alkaline phosphatase family protein [Melioribacteraceae bacterium]|nr:alkaline phosphatase family protein [Melioribacteraceae bacterium]
MRVFINIIFVIFFVSALYAQQNFLQSGPMLGHSQMREVSIWLQTKESAKVKIGYKETGSNSELIFTSEKITTSENFYTTTLTADKVEPGENYEYKVFINDEELKFDYPLEFQTQKLWQWREDPPAYKFLVGSCLYINEEIYDRPGKPYGGEYQILTDMFNKDADFMVWLGDNTYLREADWYSKTGIYQRYTHTRSLDELQPILASTHHYATWDDHEFGPNNSNRSFVAKETTLQAFKDFWANPSYGINGKPGVTTYFEWGDAAFFMMDNRYYRTPENRKTGDRQILGDEQIEWLIDGLTTTDAEFKFVCLGGQFLNTTPIGENHSTFPEERIKILNLIEKEGIEGVIFLTGDIHRTELTKLDRYRNYPLYEFTLSPLTAGPSTWDKPINNHRVDNTLVQERNYGLFEITGPRKDRKLKCSVYNSNGELKWTYEINASELKKK